jgi:hypothetical protein
VGGRRAFDRTSALGLVKFLRTLELARVDALSGKIGAAPIAFARVARKAYRFFAPGRLIRLCLRSESPYAPANFVLIEVAAT